MFKNITTKRAFNIFTIILSLAFNSLYLFFVLGLISLFFIVVENATMNIIVPFFVLLILPVLYFVYLFVKRKELKMFEFFFGLEIPVFFLALFRIFALKEFSVFYSFLFVSILTSVFFFAFDIFSIKFKDKRLKALSNVVFEIPVIIASYFFILALFGIIPCFIMLLKFIFTGGIFSSISSFFTFANGHFFETFIAFLYWLLFIIFAGLIFLLFIFSPIVSIFIYIKKFFENFNSYKTPLLCAIFAPLYILCFLIFTFHFYSVDVKDEYAAIKGAASYEELESVSYKILQKEKIIKYSLLDTYLSKIRYILDKDSDFVFNLWLTTKAPRGFCRNVQNLFNVVAFPFYYDGHFGKNKADEIYAELFDEDIQSLEADKILKAANSTLFIKEQAATLIDKASSDVKVVSREIKIQKLEDDVYKISFVDAYKNEKLGNKEVYIDFSLPYNAVITSLSLGSHLEFKGILAPKAAARKTYKKEMQRRIDPALLEKNGVCQYALRVFPVSKYRAPKDIQRVEFEYLAYPVGGKLPLPNIFETKNAYFTPLSKYNVYLDGKKIKLKNNSTEIVLDSKNEAEKQVIKGKKLAILMDTSYSNKTWWHDYLLGAPKYIFENNDVDYYFFNKFLSKKIKFEDIKRQVNFAKTARYDAYCSLSEKYDAAIMLTDSSQFDYSHLKTCTNNFPLFVVHVDKKGALPPYDIKFTNLIYQTNGNIASSIQDALVNLYDKKGEIPNKKEFLMALEIDRILRKENLNDFATKDKVYKIANDAQIVSNFSSYIALVETRQAKDLIAESKKDDKYDADLEIKKDSGFNKNSISSVPEPHEWLFIAIMAILLFGFIFRKRLKCLF